MGKAQTKTKPPAQVLGPGAPPPATNKSAVAVRDPKAGTSRAVAQVQEPANLLQVIGQMATDPDVNVAKMEALLKMKRELEREDYERVFNVALLAAQTAMPKIVKDRENSHTSSRYATLEKVANEIDHIARANGFSQSFGTDDSPLPNHYRIICDLSHVAGHTRRYKLDLQADGAGSQGKSNKTPVQAVGSTMSYGRRYIKILMFDLVIVNEDRDGNKQRVVNQHQDAKQIEHQQDDDSFPGDRPSANKLTEQQVIDLRDLLLANGLKEARFCETYRIEHLGDLAPAHLQKARADIKKFGDQVRQKRG